MTKHRYKRGEAPPNGTYDRYYWDRRHGQVSSQATRDAYARRERERRHEKETISGVPTTRDHVAPMMVQSWGQGQRNRIRAILVVLADSPKAPEMRVVAMIDSAR